MSLSAPEIPVGRNPGHRRLLQCGFYGVLTADLSQIMSLAVLRIFFFTLQKVTEPSLFYLQVLHV